MLWKWILELPQWVNTSIRKSVSGITPLTPEERIVAIEQWIQLPPDFSSQSKTIEDETLDGIIEVLPCRQRSNIAEKIWSLEEIEELRQIIGKNN